MMNHRLQSNVRRGVIPLKHLILIGLALFTLVATMLYMGFDTLARNPSADVETASGGVSDGVSSRLASLPTQVNAGGDVTIRVTWQGPDAGMAFGVVLDTHTVDLDAYDLSNMVVLRTDEGRETAPLRWEAPKGGHHREGNLVFSDKALDGRPFISAGTRSVELVIYKLADVPTRSFTWELK